MSTTTDTTTEPIQNSITPQRKAGWVVWYLAQNGPATTSEIEAAVDCHQSYATDLWREGLLSREKDGNTYVYDVAAPGEGYNEV